jgi:uncharacterized protein YuzE
MKVKAVYENQVLRPLEKLDLKEEGNRMKISFDPKYGVLYLKFSENKITNTVESDGGVLIDYGDSGQIIGIEIINASA